jgi:hypothetical protein
MSSLRQAALDEIDSKYVRLGDFLKQKAQGRYRTVLHQLNTARLKKIVEDTIGSPTVFRTKMSDEGYRKLVDLIIDLFEEAQAIEEAQAKTNVLPLQF